MNGTIYLSGIAHLLNENMPRVLLNSGVSQQMIDLLMSPALWTSEDRARMYKTLDTIIYGTCEMAHLPRVDIPAEVVASVVATVVNPINWMVCAGWLQGLRPAKDLSEPEQTVQIERCSAGRMLTLIYQAAEAKRGDENFNQMAAKIRANLGTKVEIK